MKISRLPILIFVVILIGITVLLYGYNKEENQKMPFKVTVSSSGREEEIKCWMDEQIYYVFLPAYANLKDTQININTSSDIYINDVEVHEGMCCDIFELNTPYQILLYDWPITIVREMMFVKSENLSTMFIDTKYGDTERLHSSKAYKEEATIRTYHCNGSVDYSGELSSISGRGNATWEDYEKKPYGIELVENVSLLDMGSAQEWVLLANAADPSNLRNKIVLDLAQQTGLCYSSDSQWVDLFLNGEYVGLYLLCEKNEVHPERVAISESGSFLVSVEQETRLKSQDIPHVVTQEKQALRIHYPSKVSDTEKNEILAYWQTIENALLADNGVDTESGKSWLDLIDLGSWARKYLLEEIVGNWDACYISQYFYCDGYKNGAKVFAGPAWDYDRTLGNTSWQFQRTNALYAQRLHVKGEYDTPWFHELYKKTEFYDRVVCEYKEVFIPALNQLMNNYIPEYVEYIAVAHQMDHLRWKNNNDIVEDAKYICNYISERMAFLSDLWINGQTYYFIQADPGFNQFYAYIAVKPSENVDDLRQLTDSNTSKFLGWYYTDTKEIFDSTKPINENVSIYAKWYGIPTWWKERLVDGIPVIILTSMFFCVFAIFCKRSKTKR